MYIPEKVIDLSKEDVTWEIISSYFNTTKCIKISCAQLRSLDKIQKVALFVYNRKAELNNISS